MELVQMVLYVYNLVINASYVLMVVLVLVIQLLLVHVLVAYVQLVLPAILLQMNVLL